MLYISKILFLLAIVLSAMSISILKERVDKKDALLTELNTNEKIFENFLKNTPPCSIIENYNTEKCNGFKKAEDHLKQTRNQVIALKFIEDRGLPPSICGSISAIASGSPGFELDCYKLEKHEECDNLVPDERSKCHGGLDYNLIDKDRNPIIYNSIKNNFRYLYFDRLPSELLYFILVLFCSLIGSIYKLKLESKDLSDLKCTDIITSFSQGFIAYIIITGAKYVVGFGSQGIITNINPYSVAFVGCLAGMFFDGFFNIKPKLENIPVEPTPGVG